MPDPGQNPNCRIADPADASRVFKWLLQTTFDDKGNVIFYEYKAEDSTGLNPAAANERNRYNGLAPFTNTYIKRIHYGPRSPYRRDEDLSKRTDWLFEVVFDYGEQIQQIQRQRRTPPAKGKLAPILFPTSAPLSTFVLTAYVSGF